MSKLIHIVLPEATIETLNRMAKPGHHSRFINQAGQHFIATRSAEALRAQLEHTAVRDYLRFAELVDKQCGAGFSRLQPARDFSPAQGARRNLW